MHDHAQPSHPRRPCAEPGTVTPVTFSLRRRIRAGRRQAGVTLIEMLVVLAIIAAMTAAAVPAMLEWNENERVKSFARAIADAFALARSEAIRSGNTHLLVFANGITGAGDPIVIVDDGTPAASDCTIAAGEVVHSVPALPNISWGTSAANANGTAVASDDGNAVANIAAGGSSFTDASMASTQPASWVLFMPDGIPRNFTPGAGVCSAVGNAGDAAGAIYISNGNRDYSVVMRPLGTTRVHRWTSGGWSS